MGVRNLTIFQRLKSKTFFWIEHLICDIYGTYELSMTISGDLTQIIGILDYLIYLPQNKKNDRFISTFRTIFLKKTDDCVENL